MLRRKRLRSALLLLTTASFVTAGCRVTAELSHLDLLPNPTRAEPAPRANAGAKATSSASHDADTRSEPAVATPAHEVRRGGDPLHLFGDKPDSERVPFENRLITNLRQHSFTADGLDFDPDVYEPDDLLVFASTRNSQHPDIYLKLVEGFTLTQLTADPADDIQPRFSPDGQRVVFCSNRGGTWDIWMINRDGTGLTQLTRDGPDEIAPSFSPDGSQVAYTAWGDRSHQWEIWTLTVDRPGVRRFLAYGMFPTWAPSGRKLAFQRSRERGGRLFSIWTVDLVDGEARHPTEIAHSDSAACVAPRFSSDGRMIVYCAIREGERAEATDRSTPPAADLWVVETHTGLRMMLSDGAAADFNPVWAGRRIFFVSSRAGNENIWSLTMALRGYEEGDARISRGSSVSTDLTED